LAWFADNAGKARQHAWLLLLDNLIQLGCALRLRNVGDERGEKRGNRRDDRLLSGRLVEA
jgi:hypothetical protein